MAHSLAHHEGTGRDTKREMEIRELAQQVLFGATLTDKLATASTLTDQSAGPALTGTPDPGRPDGLQFQRPSAKRRVKRPGIDALEHPAKAGRLLHSFANHELLAAELMALVLLRFPTAPRSFRRGIATALVEEQTHLGLYLNRMSELGVAFGEVGVNRFFWDCVADVPEPIDFVSRMSLVFEQANLDFTHFYAQRFRQIGDETTAQILDQVHDDEIGHVKHGLHWFRQWRDPDATDWQEWVKRLHRPLGPSRAKAEGYDRATRIKIGFDPDYIDQLEVWGETRGRPAVVWHFNPTVEAELADPLRALPPAVTALQGDLAPLMAALAETGDVVLVRNPPATSVHRAWRDAGLPAVEWVASGDPPGTDLTALRDRRFRGLAPWAMAPSSPLTALRERSDSSGRADAGERDRSTWAPPMGAWYSKARVPDLLRALRDVLDESWLAGPEHAPHVVTDLQTAIDVHTKSGASTVFKAALSTSGRGLRRARAGEPAPERWLRRTLHQGPVLTGPWLSRVADLSLHFDVQQDAVYRDYSRFTVSPGGQFEGAVLGRRLAGLPTAVVRFLHGDGKDQQRLRRLGEAIAVVLSEQLPRAGFRGPVGVDTFVYSSDAGLKIMPIVELNPRCTMGRVSLGLERAIAPGRTGWWTLVNQNRVQKMGFDSLSHWASGLAAPVFHRNHLQQGVILLTDPDQARHVCAVLTVQADLEACRASCRFLIRRETAPEHTPARGSPRWRPL